ncbi:hypothetical protein HNQ03_002208 [Chryseobacterium sp. 16F]|uniref:Uncharacterized protein n=2 Tax=Frigoriflavimonas asaccharolytica TaxID=2735899 RepID=A0A8J8K9J2_9FLAO|nr:hypothetical protein [Frigoriflavimonas asaccharolytica]
MKTNLVNGYQLDHGFQVLLKITDCKEILG